MGHGNICKVYEQIAHTDLATEGIRPGGLVLTEKALAWCKFPLNSRILDVGCGSGITLDYLTHIHELAAVGIDTSSALLDRGRTSNQGLALVRAAGEKLPFPDESVDGAFVECSLSVMRGPGRALDEFRRVLKNGGKLVLSDVYARNPEGVHQLRQMPVECCLRGAFCKEELLGKLTNRHFKIHLWQDYSELLARFAVELIFYYGSMDQFWLRSGAGSIDAEQIRRAVSEAKPGYFLLLAEKTTSARERTDNDG